MKSEKLRLCIFVVVKTQCLGFLFIIFDKTQGQVCFNQFKNFWFFMNRRRWQKVSKGKKDSLLKNATFPKYNTLLTDGCGQ